MNVVGNAEWCLIERPISQNGSMLQPTIATPANVMKCTRTGALVRPPNESEIRQTLVIALPLSEASAKVRTGPPVDEEEDYALDVWAGVIPMTLRPEEPVRDGGANGPPPAYVADYERPRA